MNNPLKRRSWSPFVVGALIGVLSWFSFAMADRPLGISTAFETTAAAVVEAAVPAMAESNRFFGDKPVEFGWGWALVVGVFLGALLSARLSGDHDEAAVPALWRERFGASPALRYAGAFVGGLLMLFGARVAGGCTSGHGISGTLQLAASGWLFVMVAFPVGILTAFLVFGTKGRAHV